MNTILIVIAVAVVLALVLRPKGKGKSTKPPAPASKPDWYIGPIANGKNYSEGMPARPTMQGVGWTFAFPKSGGVDAVVNTGPPSLIGSAALVMRFSVTGGGFHPSNDDSGVPASVGLSIQRKGDNWSGAGKYQGYRWYSSARVTLKEGEFTLTAPLTSPQWHDVQGQSNNAAAFLAAINDLDNLSVVFGGKFSSHGVYATESSRFTLLALDVL